MTRFIIFLFGVLFTFSCNNKPEPFGAAVSNGVDSVALKSLDPTKGIYPEIWGAKGDGKNDDTWALNECYKYVLALKGYGNLTVYWTKIYRTTAPINISTPFVDGEGWFKMINASSPGYSQVNYNLTRYKPLVSTVGIGKAGLYADFNDTTKIQPAILFNLQGDGRYKESEELYTIYFKGIAIHGKGYYDLTPKGEKRRMGYPNSNVAGLVCLYNTGVKIEDCNIVGFKYGIVGNYSYFLKAEYNDIKYCKTGIYNYGCASSSCNANRYTGCELALDVRSSAFSISNDYAVLCPSSLHIGAGGVVVTNMYMESYNCDSTSQVVIGDSPGEPFYPKGNGDWVEITMFINPTIVAMKTNKTPGNSILMKESARTLLILGGGAQSSTKTGLSPLNSIEVWGTKGVWPSPLCKKITAN